MNLAEYAQMYSLETSHWYFTGKRHALKSILERRLHTDGVAAPFLDVGCGTGIILEMLKQFGRPTGVDISSVALDFCRQRGHERLALIAPGGHLPFENDFFSLICAFDILEHLDDDLQLLREMGRVCAPGGSVFLTVPAFDFLWSEHDEALHHRRRYTASGIRSLVERAGLRVHWLSYFNTILFPIAAIFRGFKRLTPAKPQQGKRSEFFVPVPGPINTAWRTVLELEGRFLRYGRLPYGVSVICLAKK